MKLPFALSLTLAVASGAFACSSSGSSASPGGPDGSSPDDAGNNSSNTGNDANDNSATDSSTSSATDSSDDATDSSSSVVDAGPLSFATDIYAPIIEVHCVGCHGFEADGGPASGVSFGKLDMHSVNAGYANLVNVAAAGGSCAENRRFRRSHSRRSGERREQPSLGQGQRVPRPPGALR